SASRPGLSVTRYFVPSANDPFSVTEFVSTVALKFSGSGVIEIQRETVSAVISLASSFVNNTMTRRPAMRLLSAAMLVTANGFTVPISISAPLAFVNRINFTHASAFTFALKRIRKRGAAGASSGSAPPSGETPFTRIGGVSAVSLIDAVTARPAASFNPARKEIWYLVPSGKIAFGAKVPLRVLNQTNRPSIGGAKTSGETGAGFPT